MDNHTGGTSVPSLLENRKIERPSLHPAQLTGKEPIELEIVEQDSVFDKSNPRSLISLLSPSMQEHLEGTKNFLLHDLSDESVRKNISHMREYPLLTKLRQSFWLEHQRVSDNGRAKMENSRIWQGITTSSGEFYNLMKRPEFAAYVFTQPVAMEVRNLSLAETGWQRMMEIMSVSAVEYDSLTGKPSKINDKLARVQLEIWKHSDERLQGGALKRVAVTAEQKNLNVNVNQDNVSVTHKLDMNSFQNPEEIRKKIAELRAQMPDTDIETTATTVEEDDE